ncbi:hypothetical protein PAXRUDRAFT_833262, partial [Paxillus rubicundulus Ve08.2h10]
MMRCDESPHGFRAGATTPRLWESGGTNSGSRESRDTNSDIPEKRSWCSGSGVHCILS